MITVHRSGSIVSIPKRLSHHVPTVPIIESVAFENKIKVTFHDIDAEEFQIYKFASEEEYKLGQQNNLTVLLQSV